MFVQVDQNDRVIATSTFGETKVVVAQQADSDAYILVMERDPKDELLYRSDIVSTMNQFAEVVSTMESGFVDGYMAGYTASLEDYVAVNEEVEIALTADSIRELNKTD